VEPIIGKTHPHLRRQYEDWLTCQGQAARTIPLLLDAYCRFLRAHGLSVRRCNLATDTVHPQMRGTRHVWYSEEHDPGPIDPSAFVRRNHHRLGEAMIDEVFFNANSRSTSQFRASPFHVLSTQEELYEPIRPEGEAQPFPLFHDLAAIGCTAYYALRLHGFSSAEQKIGIAVDNSSGLSPREIDDLRWSLRLLTLHLSTLIEYNIKTTLAEVYVGHDPGRRVCSGMIALGQVISIEGAIWFSDINGFTKLSEALTASELVASLNAYYQEIVSAIYQHGGEVLKYIGDAVLAIFPVEKFVSARAACLAAWSAAEDSRARLEAFNARRRADGAAPLEDSLALHFGIAEYGNIGSDERLDFTLIGREVNLASRVKAMTDGVAERILFTEAFADTSGLAMRPLGAFAARGFHEKVPIFAPR
jgi:adenylate cyclase